MESKEGEGGHETSISNDFGMGDSVTIALVIFRSTLADCARAPFDACIGSIPSLFSSTSGFPTESASLRSVVLNFLLSATALSLKEQSPRAPI